MEKLLNNLFALVSQIRPLQQTCILKLCLLGYMKIYWSTGIQNFKFQISKFCTFLLTITSYVYNFKKNGASFKESVWQYKPRCCNAGNHWTDRLGKIKTTWWAYPSWEVSKWRYTRRLRWQVSKVARTTTGLVVEGCSRSRVIQTVIHSPTNQATVLFKILPTFWFYVSYIFHFNENNNILHFQINVKNCTH